MLGRPPLDTLTASFAGIRFAPETSLRIGADSAPDCVPIGMELLGLEPAVVDALGVRRAQRVQRLQ